MPEQRRTGLLLLTPPLFLLLLELLAVSSAEPLPARTFDFTFMVILQIAWAELFVYFSGQLFACPDC